MIAAILASEEAAADADSVATERARCIAWTEALIILDVSSDECREGIMSGARFRGVRHSNDAFAAISAAWSRDDPRAMTRALRSDVEGRCVVFENGAKHADPNGWNWHPAGECGT